MNKEIDDNKSKLKELFENLSKDLSKCAINNKNELKKLFENLSKDLFKCAINNKSELKKLFENLSKSFKEYEYILNTIIKKIENIITEKKQK